MRRWATGVSAAILTTAAALLSLPSRPSDVELLQAQRMVIAQSKRSLLSLLSPPGAGYDSTSVALTTGSGSPVTVTRASIQTCEVTPGVLTSIAADKPCVESGALKVEPAGTNLLLRSAELDDVAWVNTGSPAVTANTWDFGFGSIQGETITDDDAAVGEGRRQTYTTAATGTYTASCYLQSGSLISARLVVNAVGGTGSTTCSFSDLSTTTLRKSCSITAGGALTGVLVGAFPGANDSDVGTVKVGGCQLETGSVATSYIPTGASTASRAAQTTTVATPAGLSTTEGAAKVCVTPTWTGSNPTGAPVYYLNGNAANTVRFGYSTTGSDFCAYDGTTSVCVAQSWIAGTRACFRTSWSAGASALRVENLSAGTSSSGAFTAFPSFAATIGIGNSGGGSQPPAKLDSICLSATSSGCR